MSQVIISIWQSNTDSDQHARHDQRAELLSWWGTVSFEKKYKPPGRAEWRPVQCGPQSSVKHRRCASKQWKLRHGSFAKQHWGCRCWCYGDTMLFSLNICVGWYFYHVSRYIGLVFPGVTWLAGDVLTSTSCVQHVYDMSWHINHNLGSTCF